MHTFFLLEGAYLILAGVILLVTLFVTTRPFMAKGAVKKGLLGVSLLLAVLIGAHYWITMNRMAEVAKAFEAGKPILCESRMLRKASQVVEIEKSRSWHIENNNFVSPYFERPFFLARCIVK